MATLYDTLGVPAHATDDEIKRAYRKAAMKWHPDRNHGAEDIARAAFQEIKDAYAILSDAGQRKVYDTVYAEQMREWEAEHMRRQRAQAEREAAARAADEAAYAAMVSIAIRFADQGHNRDVLFGVLLGRQCEAQRAAQIADSVAALQAARRDEAHAAQNAQRTSKTAKRAQEVEAGADEREPGGTAQETSAAATASERSTGRAEEPAAAHDAPDTNRANHARRDESASDAHPVSALGNLWFQFLNGLKF
ncbi:J domain-containing protein [Paraburkholderia sp. MMS20-SJTN17]|uniref:J domain-containing protein n=1 Tax=Paraburkholderia translucens TaxID=2886945 RepID=A0ABS8K760_9BURK|nr:J domain-containing protein [Paraburkholderia sp. MMS20-SJTN17]MCC8400573.1 J domain-containing protein [Paraburkholderia sp. MMS20-SJTN17]